MDLVSNLSFLPSHFPVFPTCMLIGNFNVVSKPQSELEGLKRDSEGVGSPSFLHDVGISLGFSLSLHSHSHITLAKHFVVNKVISHT